MVIKTVCGSGLGSSLLVSMNVKKILDRLGVEAEVEHTNISSFQKQGVDYVVCGLDVAPALDFPEEKKLKLKNILSKDETEKGLIKMLGLKAK